MSGGAGDAETDEVFRLSGMMDVIQKEGVTFFDHNRPPFVDVEIDYPPQPSIKINPKILDYEVLISINQLKVHSSATVTLSMKNIAISYPAADYYGHPRMSYKNDHEFFNDLHLFIAAMAKRFPVDLAITAGHPAMIGMGPLGGYTFETGLVIASRDPIAADTVGAKLLGFSPQAVRHLWEARRMKLGETQIDNMEFLAMSLEAAKEAYSRAAYGRKIQL